MEHEILPTENSIFEKAQTPSCQNCGAVVSGRFCAACGQKHPQERFTVRALLHSAYEHTFEFDRGFFFTLRELFLHPARVIREYVSGRRSIYANPVKYLAIWLGISTLLMTMFVDPEKLTLQAQRQIIQDPVSAPVRKQSPRMRQMQADISDIQRQLFQNPQFIYALLVPLLSVFTALLLRGSGFNYAEHLVFNTYLMAQNIVLYVPFYPLYRLLPNHMMVVSEITLLLSVLYFAGVAGVVFRHKSRLAVFVRAFFAYVFAYAALMLVGVLVGVLYAAIAFMND